MSFINFSKIQFICVSIMIIVFFVCVLFKKFFEAFLLEAPLFIFSFRSTTQNQFAWWCDMSQGLFLKYGLNWSSIIYGKDKSFPIELQWCLYYKWGNYEKLVCSWTLFCFTDQIDYSYVDYTFLITIALYSLHIL